MIATLLCVHDLKVVITYIKIYYHIIINKLHPFRKKTDFMYTNYLTLNIHWIDLLFLILRQNLFAIKWRIVDLNQFSAITSSNVFLRIAK